MKKALAITHVAFEDPASLATMLRESDFALETVDACTADFNLLDPTAPDLVVVMGGPIGVYERQSYPFLNAEVDWVARRIASGKPIVGLCLGAQLMAAALGASVHPGKNGKEIGWFPVFPAKDAALYPEWKHLFATPVRPLHWHGDTFDLPEGVHHIAFSAQYQNQAFAKGPKVLGIQCHPEVTATGLERWYVGHACELAHAGIDVAELRSAGRVYAPQLEAAGRLFWKEWLAGAFAE